MPTPLSAATGGLRSCGPHQASVWACLPTAWQSLGRPKKTPGGQPDRRRRWRMPSPPYVCTTLVSGAAWLSSSERSAHHMSSLIGSVGPNSIVSFPAATGQRQTAACEMAGADLRNSPRTRLARQISPTHPPPETPPVPPAQTPGTLAPSEVRPPAARQLRPRRRVRQPSMRGGRGAGRVGSRGSSLSARAGWC